MPESSPVKLDSPAQLRQFQSLSCLNFSMASAETEHRAPFSLDSYYVSEKVGFVLPDPLVGRNSSSDHFDHNPESLCEMLGI